MDNQNDSTAPQPEEEHSVEVTPELDRRVDHVVVDTSAFLRNVPLERLAKRLYTTADVLSEIRDAATRARLRAPQAYSLTVRQPTPAALAHVTACAKRTGDYTALSLTDLKVMALSYELHELHSPPEDGGGVTVDSLQETVVEMVEEEEEEAEEDEDAASDDSEDDEAGWVTADNLAAKTAEWRACGEERVDPVRTRVACLTSDFAMQNVLLRMRLAILGVEGSLVRRPRAYVLWCAACFARSLQLERRFCGRCGNATLHRISAQLREDGQLQLFFRAGYQYRLRGSVFSIPTPRGGKHGALPSLCEDQPRPQQRPATRKAQARAAVLPVDDASCASNDVDAPFSMNDLTSRAARLGIQRRLGGDLTAAGVTPHWAQRNPNEARPNTGNNRRKKRRN